MERIGWAQEASSVTELATVGFAVYVDDARSPLTEVSCASTRTAEGYACSGRLPLMSSGLHTLSLVAFALDEPSLESGRSAVLRVNVTTGATSAGAIGTSGSWQRTGSSVEDMVTSDGVRLRATLAASDIGRPLDLSRTPDGGWYVIETGASEPPETRDAAPQTVGLRIRTIRDGKAAAPAAGEIADAIAVGTGGEPVAALAVDPDYAKSGYVFVAYSGPEGVRLVRFRVSRERFVDRVILMDRLPLSPVRPTVALRFGPDRHLYLATDDGGEPEAAGDLGSFSGKVLRLTADGTTPRDQRGLTPVYAISLHAPRGLAWSRPTALWVVDGPGASGTVNRLGLVPGQDELRLVVDEGRRGRVAERYRLPAGIGATSLAIHPGRRVPEFRGHLFVAARSGGILRLRRRADARAIEGSEWLMSHLEEPIRAIGIDADGAIVALGDRLILTLEAAD